VQQMCFVNLVCSVQFALLKFPRLQHPGLEFWGVWGG